MDFTIIKAAGLTQQEFANLCEVSRTTVNLWTSGKMQPHRFICKNVERVLAVIAKAVEEQKLPPESTRPNAYQVAQELLSQATDDMAAN
ncbi:MAG TPA: helix-turn-helix transcriptional regulator [Thiobacillus sp.]|uniref:helix-turn-helix transcriptional regulator n=1 Tax=Acidovorax sp. TaxID=1872122 RepID=UPI00260EB906|nr:helix-turn-helix transcriptional regulator [Acidovorax sp.]HQT19125.1 helix-turn-helix transcriptional regulator [Acidovorax defluvii]HQT71405.1 helix-turn-helix transcriptional regulator [Thiobacillus sp.]